MHLAMGSIGYEIDGITIKFTTKESLVDKNVIVGVANFNGRKAVYHKHFSNEEGMQWVGMLNLDLGDEQSIKCFYFHSVVEAELTLAFGLVRGAEYFTNE